MRSPVGCFSALIVWTMTISVDGRSKYPVRIAKQGWKPTSKGQTRWEISPSPNLRPLLNRREGEYKLTNWQLSIPESRPQEAIPKKIFVKIPNKQKMKSEVRVRFLRPPQMCVPIESPDECVQ